MKRTTSILLTKEARTALNWLREQPGGFNLNGTINRLIVEEAKRRGKA